MLLLPQRGLLRLIVLGLLAEKPMHGYEILKKVEEVTRGLWRPSPGTLYTLLRTLKEEGLVVTERVEGSGVPSGLRIVYKLTHKGYEHLAYNAPKVVALLESVARFLARLTAKDMRIRV